MDLVGAFIWCWTLFWPPLVMTLGLFGLSGLYLGMKGSDRPLPKWVRNILSVASALFLLLIYALIFSLIVLKTPAFWQKTPKLRPYRSLVSSANLEEIIWGYVLILAFSLLAAIVLYLVGRIVANVVESRPTLLIWGQQVLAKSKRRVKETS